MDEIHQTGTISAQTGLLSIPRYNSTTFGLKSIYKNCINSWNKISTEINKIEQDKSKIKRKDVIDIDLCTMYSRSRLKTTIKKHFISKYDWVFNWIFNLIFFSSFFFFFFFFLFSSFFFFFFN